MTQEQGIIIKRKVLTQTEAAMFVKRLVMARVARCVSPTRKSICDNPAIMIYFVDTMKYYPCCENHMVFGDQLIWTTRFYPHVVEVAAILDKANQWLSQLSPDEYALITTEMYDRPVG